MEEALYITNIADFKKSSGKYTRIYFGNEFCQRLIPSREELDNALGFALSEGLNFTFVTGLVTEPALENLHNLLAAISGRIPDAEVVINDWGMLGIVRKYNLHPVIGRLLTKQRRDPRILNIKTNLTPQAQERLKSASIGRSLIRFLIDKSVNRMEIDNLPQGIGIGENIKDEGMHLSLYFPFNFVTTSRECVFNNGSAYLDSHFHYECGKKCRHEPIVLRHRNMPLPLYMKGNTLFLENKRLPECLLREGVDRIICQPGIPM